MKTPLRTPLRLGRILMLFCCAAALSACAARSQSAKLHFPRGADGVPGTVIAASFDPAGAYIGSPSLAILPDGTYVASHDYFGPATHGDRTDVFASADRGQTWHPRAVLTGQWCSTLFVHRNALYLLGNTHQFGDMVIRRSDDGGKTWTEPTDATHGLLARGRYHCAPLPMVEHQGRLWHAYEISSDPQKPRAFESVVLSIPVDADLLDAAQWQRSSTVKFDPAWFDSPQSEWLEGNVVVKPDGGLCNILRLNVDCRRGEPTAFTAMAKGQTRFETAVMLDLSPDGKTLRFDPERSFIHFPGAESKFTIRYDPQTRRYWSLVQKITNFDVSKNQPRWQRNVLALTSSADLRNWRVETIVLRWNEGRSLSNRERFGFQYVDWQFDGDDIVAACRTAWNGHTYHDANYVTFLRLPGFRHLTMKDATADLAGAQEALVEPDLNDPY